MIVTNQKLNISEKFIVCEKLIKNMSGMGFEPMPTYVDQILSLAP